NEEGERGDQNKTPGNDKQDDDVNNTNNTEVEIVEFDDESEELSTQESSTEENNTNADDETTQASQNDYTEDIVPETQETVFGDFLDLANIAQDKNEPQESPTAQNTGIVTDDSQPTESEEQSVDVEMSLPTRQRKRMNSGNEQTTSDSQVPTKLRETFWSDDFIDDIKHLWNGVIFTSNADNNRAGVAILVDNKWKDKVSEIHKDNSGRTLILEVDIGDIVIKLICIYAPTKAKDRIEYFSYLSNYLTSENAIIGGDFNTTFSHIDRCNTIHNFDSAYDKLSTLISDFDLYDIWRHRNQESKVYSWKRVIQGELKMSRIDFYLVSKNLGNFIKNVFYKHTTLSDHDFIYMKIDFSRIEKGPGVWIFNNTFLKDDNFINEIKSLIELEMKDMLYEREFTVCGDNLKYKIRRKCQMYGQQRNKMKYREYNFIQRQLTRFDANVTRNNFDINKYE
ncbi:hypothetical protein ScPMuIL_002165, partial [Solemya velum]